MSLFPEAGFLSLTDPAPPRTSRFRLDERGGCFEGHFEGNPILPGIAHLALALRACAEQGAGAPTLTGVKDVRFKRPLGPGDEVEVVLADGLEPSSVRFEIRGHEGIASTGVLLFAPGDGRSSG